MSGSASGSASWSATGAARAHGAATRMPFFIAGHAVASIAHARVAALRHWPTWLRAEADQVELIAAAAAPAGRVNRLRTDVPEGLQLEDLHGFDLLPMAQALMLAASDTMTVDAALVTLDFALRHRLLAAPPGAAAFGVGVGVRLGLGLGLGQRSPGDGPRDESG